MNRYHYNTKSDAGFTLIEVMIAMGIFTIIVTIGIGAVLGAISQARGSQNSRTVMDNLNFVMEDMARNIRLGSNFRCVAHPSDEQLFTGETDPVTPLTCRAAGSSGGSGPASAYEIQFNDREGKHLLYLIDSGGQVWKQKGNDMTSRERITPRDVTMTLLHSGFTVRGSDALSAGSSDGQTTVVIRLSGSAEYQGEKSTFAIQTTVTPRLLDF
jgi:prepilin-type N-terminal cleavage/methylation domain-containing protein